MLLMTALEYRRLRGLNWTATEALRAAKAKTRFAQLEQAGHVRLRIEADDVPYDHGDCGNEQETNERIERLGLWGIVVDVACPCCHTFKQVESIWGFVGDDWADSGYDTDLRLAAIEAFEKNAVLGKP